MPHQSPWPIMKFIKLIDLIASMIIYLHVNFHDVANMKARPTNAVDKFLRASDRLEVAAFFMICVSSDSLLRSSPVLVTS